MPIAGSVPKTKSKMIRAPPPPINASTRRLGPVFPPPPAASSSACCPVTWTVTPGGTALRTAARVGLTGSFAPKPFEPGGYSSAKVVWRSAETYASLPVEKYELVREPGLADRAASTARWIPRSFVTSPAEWNTRTTGGASPFPKVCRIFWFVSYAEKPGIENWSYQRFDIFCAPKTPNAVSRTQAPTMNHRRRWMKWASGASIKSF